MSYSHISDHRSMVLDEVRNRLYQDAIEKSVTSNSVVMDLGAGLGIHGLMAARAGARRVYLVEPEPIVQVGGQVATANGIGDRVTILETKIEDAELTEKVDIIVSALAGNLLFSEDLLPALFHARDKYLKRDGYLIPDRAGLVMTPISAPEVYSQRIECWNERVSGFDYSSSRQFASNELITLRDGVNPTNLSKGAIVVDLDLRSANTADCHAWAQCAIDKSGTCNGLLAWIKLRVGDVWLSASPEDPGVHWSPVMLPIDPPMTLEEGETVSITLNRPVRGDWTWSIDAPAGTRRHSTFFARAYAKHHIRRLDPKWRPGLDDHGRQLLRTLELMRQGLSNREIANELLKIDDLHLSSFREALDYVRTIAVQYGENRPV